MGCIQSADNNNNRLTRRSVHNKLQNVLTSNAIRTPKNNPEQHASLIYDKENNASAYIVRSRLETTSLLQPTPYTKFYIC